MMGRDPSVAEFMRRQPHTIGSDQSLAAAARRMHQLNVRHLPVLAGGRLVGILSERDVALVESLPGADSEQIRVEEAMTAEPYTVSRETALREVAQTMADRRCGTAIVVDGERVEGILTTTDAMRALAGLLGS